MISVKAAENARGEMGFATVTASGALLGWFLTRAAAEASAARELARVPERFALVHHASLSEVQAYLPKNYKVVALHRVENGPVKSDVSFLVAGRDSAGWTLDGYVIPRYLSGLVSADEVDAEQAQRMLLEQVDLAWYEVTKGEITGDDDPGTEMNRLILALYAEAVANVLEVAQEQYGRHGVDAGALSDEAALEDAPRRVAEALSLVMYGGRVVA